MFCLVDNEYNNIWGFYEDLKAAQDAQKEQNTPSYYRIEEVQNVSKYFDDNGKLIKQRFEG